MITKRVDVTEPSVMKDFLESIDWNVLNNFVKTEYGISTEFKWEIVKNYNNTSYIKIFSSDNLVENTGIFSNVLKEMKLQDFGVWLKVTRTWENENEYNKYTDDDDIKLCVSMNMRYEQFDGGSNGMNLFYGYYDKQNGWKFEKVKKESR